ncbi:hypothetical protein O7630_32820 [Micromonospora sp. WMMD718]|uniref:hypothetical protein n=1 Tax=unclassified Micromonospora TaxID=2617518 RepID=UPI000ABCE973|nr:MULTISPECIES: hypothetical protein [unclassified Micromonospora]MDG4755731.1 hypothetical protein [Micromonospora sp. WMMD718]
MIRLRGTAWSHGLLAIAAVLAGALVGLVTNIVTTSPRVWPAGLAAVAFYAAVEVIRAVAALRRAPAAALTEASDPASANPTADLTAVVVAHLTSVQGASAQPPARRDDGAEPPAGRLRGSAQARHLFAADWRPILGDSDESEPTREARPAHVEVPLLSDWLTTERSRLSAADVPDEIKTQLLRPIRAAQGQLRG